MPLISPFRNAVSFWGQTASNLGGLSSKRDCSPETIEEPRHSGILWPKYVTPSCNLNPKLPPPTAVLACCCCHYTHSSVQHPL